MRGQALRYGVLLGALAATGVHAQGPEAKRPDAGPPVAIGGFRHQLLPPRIYMNVCEAATCTPGSKVSYLFIAASPQPSFEQYRAERTRIEEALRRRVVPGTAVTFDPPQQITEKLFTIFKARRVDAFANGSKAFVWSQRVYGARMAVEIISSSPSDKAAQSNLDVFTMALMLISQAEPGAAKDR